MRRTIWLTLLLLLVAVPASAFNKKEMAYLDQQFKAIQEGLTATKAMVKELEGRQVEILASLSGQDESMKIVDGILGELRTRMGENSRSLAALFTSLTILKGDVSGFREETGKKFQELAIRPTSTAVMEPLGLSRGMPLGSPRALEGYITAVQGETVTIDRGTAHGLKGGERLAAFLAVDPETQVGELEVSGVVESQQAQCRVMELKAGVSLDFGDIVRLQRPE